MYSSNDVHTVKFTFTSLDKKLSIPFCEEFFLLHEFKELL